MLMDDILEPLAQFTSEELVHELLRRFKAALIIYEPHSEKVDDEDEEWPVMSYTGGTNAAIGLAMRAKRRLLRGPEEEDDED